MNLRRQIVPTSFALLLAVVVYSGTAGHRPAVAADDQPALPPAATHQVDFHREILPILAHRCITCHARGRAEGGFSLETRSAALGESDSGPAVLPGNSAESLLIKLVAGVDPDQVMPKQGRRLTAEEIGLLRAWIDQGVAWDADVSLRTLTLRAWEPRSIELPPAAADVTHPIDRLLAPYAEKHGVNLTSTVDDQTFARRLYYDLIGLPPTPEAMQAFLADAAPDKRERLAQALLADNSRYAEHWLSFWNDLLRNDYEGTGYINGGRLQITPWLYGALSTNKPLGQFVRDLVEPAEGAGGFVKGIVWRGSVNASQKPPIQAAQNLAQVFLGINLKCASCHDSFVSQWKLADAYSLASVFSDEPLEIFRCDKTTGQFAQPQFLNSELGQISIGANRPQRQKELAALVTLDRNARLRRTIVNRLWQRFFGRALVEPVDEIDNPAWNDDLLDWLADDLSAHGDDLKHLMLRIVTSRAYGLPSVGADPSDSKLFVFHGPTVRRLTAEQFIDTIWMNTDAGPTQAAGNFQNPVALAGSDALTAKWIWSYAEASDNVPKPGERITVRHTFELPARPTKAWAVVTCDNEFTLLVNGRQLTGSKDWTQPMTVRLEAALKAGKNEIVILARNAGESPNPAGLFFEARISATANETITVASDETWQWSPTPDDKAAKPPADQIEWKTAVPLANQAFANTVRDALALAAQRGATGWFVRAAMVSADPLMRALGRPIRDQVVTTRPESFTTLEALDLTNGSILAGLLVRGANNLIGQNPSWTADQASELVFQEFLCRPPTAAERDLAAQIVGSPPTPEGLTDLLWSVLMLPDFQLIR